MKKHFSSPDFKYCRECGEQYFRGPNDSQFVWAFRVLCSKRSCRNSLMVRTIGNNPYGRRGKNPKPELFEHDDNLEW